MGSLSEFNELIYVKHLQDFLAYNKSHMNVCYYDYYLFERVPPCL